jgi:F0F1-type ATP synthase assembly protein I
MMSNEIFMIVVLITALGAGVTIMTVSQKTANQAAVRIKKEAEKNKAEGKVSKLQALIEH